MISTRKMVIDVTVLAPKREIFSCLLFPFYYRFFVSHSKYTYSMVAWSATLATEFLFGRFEIKYRYSSLVHVYVLLCIKRYVCYVLSGR